MNRTPPTRLPRHQPQKIVNDMRPKIPDDLPPDTTPRQRAIKCVASTYTFLIPSARLQPSAIWLDIKPAPAPVARDGTLRH